MTTSGDLEEELAEKKPGNMTHMITLTIGVNGPEAWLRVYGLFTDHAQQIGDQYPYVSVSSSQTEDEVDNSDLTFNEGTMFKVRHALLSSSMDAREVDVIINELQNDGIIFRERK